MRIAILSNGSPLRRHGGAEIVAFANAKSFVARGHEVIMVTTSLDPNDAGRVEHEGVAIHTIHTDRPSIFREFTSVENPALEQKLDRLLLDFGPDAVHAHNIQTHLSFSSLRIANKLGARVVLTCHDVTPVHQGRLTGLIPPGERTIPHRFDYRVSGFQLRSNALRNGRIRRVLLRYVDRVVAVSEALKDVLEQNGIGNIEVVRNGIDAAQWDAPKNAVEAWKKARGIGDTAVLFGGRLVADKGCRQIVDAFALAAKRVPGAQLVVIGQTNGVAAQMQAQAAALGVARQVVFVGWLAGQELCAAFHAAALVATPSICFDSLLMMNLEAMACAKPVISTCLGGAREAVADGVTGYIVNPYDKAAFADRLAELLTNEVAAKQFGRAGLQRVVSEFSVSASVDRLEHLFCPKPRTRRIAAPVRANALLEQPVS